MKKNSLSTIIGVITAVAALTAAVTAFLLYRDKVRRDERELEEYLDCSIL